MKTLKSHFGALALSVVAATASAQPAPSLLQPVALAQPTTGRIERLENFASRHVAARHVDVWLPADYDPAKYPSRRYQVLYMHDGQNLWDDHDCCFGHTGWELNVTLDAEISAGRVAPIVVIGAASTVARNDEYGLSAAKLAAFLAFQVTELQPHALAQVRWNHQRVAVAGSSLGGLVSMDLALAHPETYNTTTSLPNTL